MVANHISGTPRATGVPHMQWYLSYRDREAQRRIASMMVAIRFQGDATAVAGRVRTAIAAAQPDLPILKIDTAERQLNVVLALDRLIAAVSEFFGALALLLIGLGLYGLIAYATAQRTGEIGIRMALGASRSGVLYMVVREGARLVVTGIAIGLPASLLLHRFVQLRLFGIEPTDTPTIVAAMALLLAVAGLSCYLPARRAAAVEPVVALRHH